MEHLTRNGSELDPIPETISTKISVPPLRQNHLVRERLSTPLEQDGDHSITILTASAGYGKTSLMAEWATKPGQSVAWVTLSRSENDLRQFWTYLTASLMHLPGLSWRSFRRISLVQEPPFEPLLRPIVSELESVGHSLTIFVDDFHEIDDTNTLLSFASFLELLPRNVKMVIGSRKRIPLKLGRLRATGRVHDYHTKQIAFNLRESREFMSRVLPPDVDASDLDPIIKKVDGWVTGLQIAAAGLRDTQRRQEFILAFSGKRREIWEFLRQEVLQSVGPCQREFLVKTSFLDRFSSKLCDWLFDVDNSQKRLDEIERSDLFLVSLDEAHEWFRYHRLFADVLRQEFLQLDESEKLRLQARAGRWFREQGLLEESVQHGILGEDWDTVLESVERVAGILLKTNRAGKLQSWFYRLPPQVLRSSPSLSVRLARAQMFGSLRSNYEALLKEPERIAHETGDSVLAANVATVRAHAALVQGDYAEARNLVTTALTSLPQGENLIRGICDRTLGTIQLYSDEPKEALASYAKAFDECMAAGNTYSCCGVLALKGQALGRLGRLSEGMVAIQESRELADRGLDEPVIQTLFCEGSLLFDSLRLEEAKSALSEYETICESTGYRIYGSRVNFLLARIEHLLGRPELVRQHLARAQALTLSCGGKGDHAVYDTIVARFDVAGSHFQSAVDWADSIEASRPAFLSYEKAALILKARIGRALEQGQLGSVEPLLEKFQLLRDQARVAGRETDVLDSLVSCSTARFQLGEVDLALSYLGEAIEIAQRTGFLRSFLEEGPKIIPTCQEAIRRSQNREFLEKIAALGNWKSVVVDTFGDLSSREIEILRLLAMGYQNSQIAERLFVSPNTVKTHLKHVFLKLGTTNRTQAVAKARDLRLV